MIDYDPNFISGIQSPLPMIQMYAVKRSRFAIMHIKRPCRAAQMYVINHYADMVDYIKNIHPDVKEYLIFKTQL